MPGQVFIGDKKGDRLIAAEDAAIAVGDRGFTLGDGAFETIAVVGGSASRLARHVARLDNALQVLGFETRPGSDRINAAVGDTITANGIDTGALRITVSRGVGARGLAVPESGTPTLVITVAEGLPPAAPVTAMICRTTRRNELSPLSRIKSLCYLDNILALEEARKAGADEAILLNMSGALAGATAANLFLVGDGRLLTPRVEDGALPGLVREDIIAAGNVEEATLDEAALAEADEAFLTNCLSIRPLVGVDDRPVGNGTAGKVTAEIIRSFETAVA